MGREQWRLFLRDFRAYCNQRLGEQGGYHLHYAGDGQVLIFGYPQASEHDAVRAALNIIRDLPDAPQPAGVQVNVRIGIATGAVLINRGAAKDDEAPHVVGSMVNLSARLQQGCAGTNGIGYRMRRMIWSLSASILSLPEATNCAALMLH